nr:hypothetical protein [Bacteroidota bacterium]
PAEGTSTRVTNLIIEVTSDAISQTYLDTSMNTLGFTINKSFVKGLANKEIWTFIIRDKNRLTNSTSIDICRDTATGFGPVRYIQNLMLSAQNNSDPGSFYSFESESVYTLQEAFEVQELIDLVYYFGEDSHTMGSPGANIENGIFEGDLQSWNIRRTTRFIELNIPPEVFEVSTNDSLLIASYMEGSGKRKAKLLAPGMIFSFKTENLKYGIFRVIEVTGTDNGTVKIDVKVQD